MSTEIISDGNNFEIIKSDRSFGGVRTSVFKIDGKTGEIFVNGELFDPAGDEDISGDLVVGGTIAATGNITTEEDITADGTIAAEGDISTGAGDLLSGRDVVASRHFSCGVDGSVGGDLNVGNDLTVVAGVTAVSLAVSTDKFRANATGIGAFGATPAAQQISGANLTNNVTTGGVDNTVGDIVAAAGEATASDLTTTRNALYQLARKLKQVNDALRVYGILT